MKIAVIHTKFVKSGGMESYMLDLIQGFILAQDQVDLYVFERDQKLDILSGCKLIEKKFYWTPRRLRPLLFPDWIDKKLNKNQYDFCIALARVRNSDIAICGGNHPGYLTHMGKAPSLRDRKYIQLENECFHSSQYIICHSKMMRDEIVHHYSLNPEKIRVIYPSTNPAKFHWGLREHRQAFADQYNIDLNKLNFLFPSTGHKRKGFFELLEAFSKLPSNRYELLMVGDRPKTPLPENIRYLGFVDDIEKLYTAADYTLLPSKYEPFGLVVPESLACGTPVIVSKYTGAAELLSAGDGIILDDISPDGIYNTLLEIEQKKFDVRAGFIDRNGLSIEEHILQIKKLLYHKK